MKLERAVSECKNHEHKMASMLHGSLMIIDKRSSSVRYGHNKSLDAHLEESRIHLKSGFSSSACYKLRFGIFHLCAPIHHVKRSRQDLPLH